MQRNYAASILGFSLAASACIEHECPSGYVDMGERCYRCHVVEGPDGSVCVVGDAAISAANEVDASKDSATPGDVPDVAEGDASHSQDTPPEDAGKVDAGIAQDAAAPGDCGIDRSATGCETIDRCAPNPCKNGAACAIDAGELFCACSSGFFGDTCDKESCGPITIRSRADLAKYQRCAEITGDLVIEAKFGNLTSADLPQLEVVRGSVEISPRISLSDPAVETARAVALRARVIEGGIAVLTSPAGPHEISFPRLETIGTEGQLVPFSMIGQARKMDLPELRIVHGNIMWMGSNLCTLDVHNVQRVTGDIAIQSSPHLLYSSVVPLINATAGAKAVGPIGCCLLADRNDCTGADTSGCAMSSCQP